MSYWSAALAFASFGDLEPAAVLLAAMDPRFDQSTGVLWFIELTTSADAAVLAGLGKDRLAELGARGATAEPAETVTYLRTEADRVLSGDSKR